MADTLSKPIPRRVNAQQLAWGVLLIAFAIFCVIVTAVIIGIHYFLFQSTVPMEAVVRVARGTASVIGSDLQELAVKSDREVLNSSIVTTDLQSQASIDFLDQQDNEKLVATITIKNGSSLDLKQDLRPRFDWSGDQYWIDLKDVYGEFDIFIPDNLGRPVVVTFETTLGPLALLSAGGRYTLIASGSQVQVVNYVGEALLVAQDGHAQSVPASQSATVQAASDQFALGPTMINLLGDSTLTAQNVIDYSAPADQSTSLVWRCNSVQPQNEPAGSFSLGDADGRPALRFFRDNGAESHGETRCVQGLGTGADGLDVSTFSHISIRVTFKVQSQSLSACGTQASECPLMLQMDYMPVVPASKDNPVNSWYHGFYAFVDPNRSFPLICPSCSEQHEIVNPGVWYTYESGNFVDVFSPDQRPKSILNVRFYASGHQYDVYVSQIELLVDQANIPLPTIGG